MNITPADSTKAPMTGACGHAGCRCCPDTTKREHRRATRRRERQAVRKFLSNI